MESTTGLSTIFLIDGYDEGIRIRKEYDEIYCPTCKETSQNEKVLRVIIRGHLSVHLIQMHKDDGRTIVKSRTVVNFRRLSHDQPEFSKLTSQTFDNHA
ncbi:unnamed protein product [Xylocopa violacea]|uniref:Uncharacterized protein n=1 Tax=Xylocopa violacea TaxID=135666 RepID=A0ABP1N825_XYLVO